MEFSGLGKGLIGAGFLLILAGIAVSVIGKVPMVGRLPGDIFVKRDHFSFYFPLTTCLLISIVLTLLFRFFGRK